MCSLTTGNTPKICRLCFCPNKKRSSEPFMCLEPFTLFSHRSLIISSGCEGTLSSVTDNISFVCERYSFVCRNNVFFGCEGTLSSTAYNVSFGCEGTLSSVTNNVSFGCEGILSSAADNVSFVCERTLSIIWHRRCIFLRGNPMTHTYSVYPHSARECEKATLAAKVQ